jgi:quinone-modifying oxidoreductase subunit QmoC
MAEQVIKPDLDFVKGVIAAGGDSLKKCYQCATCSVVCNVTPDKNPFPRKEMVWAQWGLKEKFQGNPDVWLCHQCNDCTAYCPRGAKPGEVLGAIRKQTIAQYSSPGFLVNLVNNRKFMPFLFLIPAILLAIVISATGTFGIPEGEIVFTKFMPVLSIQIVFTLALVFGVGTGILGMKKFWGDMKKANDVTSGDLKGSVTDMLTELLSHKKFKDCDVSKDRATSHLLVFYSFIALGIATALGVLYIDILHLESPFRFGYGTPIKIFGTAGAIAIIAGSYLMMSNRFKNADRVGVGSYFDWLLISMIGILGLSGALAWITRVAGIAGLAYPIYFIHLVFVLSLFVYLPFSKLAHLFYRGAALSFNKYSGREAQAAAQPAVAVAASAPSEAEQTETESDQKTGQE